MPIVILRGGLCTLKSCMRRGNNMEKINLRKYVFTKEELLKKLKIKGEWEFTEECGDSFSIVVEEERK